MISLTLICDSEHEFVSSFKNSETYETLHHSNMLQCPYCGSSTIRKGLNRPNVGTKNNIKKTPTILSNDARQHAENHGDDNMQSIAQQSLKENLDHGIVFTDEQKHVMQKLQEIRSYVRSNFENVTSNFAEQARQIHYGQTDEKNIYGTMSAQETQELQDEGINFGVLPFNLDDN